MNEDELAFLPVVEQAGLLRARRLSPVKLVETYLERIDRYDDVLNAFVTVCGEQALRAAEAAEAEIAAGDYRGPLHGIPFAVNDQMAIDGVPVTAGSAVPVDSASDRDATVVARLKGAGAILVGTLNMHEFHMGPPQRFPFGTPRNPWNLDRTSGGSASAVAAGLCSFAIGGDTGDSVRTSAALSGGVGLKPTWARVSRQGVIPLAWSLDCMGTLTRNVEDSAHVLGVIAGHDPLDPTSSHRHVPDYPQHLTQDLKGVRIGLVEEMVQSEMASPWTTVAVVEAMEMLRTLGATVTKVSVPHLSETRFLAPAITEAEAASYHEHLVRDHYAKYDVNTRIGLMVGSILPAGLVSKAQRARTRLSEEIRSALQDVDVLAGAGSPDGAPRVAERGPVRSKDEARERLYGRGTSPGQLTRAFSFSGGPAMSVPCGFDLDGLPLSLHLAGPSFAEPSVLRIGHAYQNAIKWRYRQPPLG